MSLAYEIAAIALVFVAVGALIGLINARGRERSKLIAVIAGCVAALVALARLAPPA